MIYRVFRPFLILTSALLLQQNVLQASNDQHEDEKRTPKRVSEAEALDRFNKLKQSRGLIGLSLAKLPVATPSAAPSSIGTPKARVHFGDSTILTYETAESTGPSVPEGQSSLKASSSADIIVLSDQLASTSLGDSVHKRPRSRSVADASKTLQKVRAKTKLAINVPVALPLAMEVTNMTLNSAVAQALPSAPIVSVVNTNAETATQKPRTRVKKRSLSTNDSHRKRSMQILPHDEIETIESPRPLSPRVLEEGKAPPTGSLYASLQQGMFYVPAMKSYYKTMLQWTNEGQNPVIQGALDAIGCGEQGYKYKIDTSSPVERMIEGRCKTTVYPLSVYKGSHSLFTLECYQTQEGPTHNIGAAIKEALKPTEVNPHYELSKDSTLIVTRYREDITEEDRTIFVSFQSPVLETLKKQPFNVVGVKSFSTAHTYETNKGDIKCLADFEHAGYTYFMLGLKNKDFLGFIRVSSYASMVEQPQATSSAPANVSLLKKKR